MSLEPEKFDLDHPDPSRDAISHDPERRVRKRKRRRISSTSSTPIPAQLADGLSQLAELFEKMLAEQADIKQILIEERSQVSLQVDTLPDTRDVEESDHASDTENGPSELEIALASEVERLQCELARLRSELESQASVKAAVTDRGESGTSSEPTELEIVLAGEVERLREELAQLQSQFESRESSAVATTSDDAPLRLLQAALEEAEGTIESLHAEIAQLKQQLQRTPTAVQRTLPATSKAPMQSLSWDEQKKLLMAEEHSDEGESPQVEESGGASEHTEWESLLLDAQQQIEIRDAEIAALREQLAAATTPAPPTLDEVREQLLNADEVILQEREKLLALQTELEDKLRKAEIDISMERARLSRERQAIEDLQQQLAKNPGMNESSSGTKKRRWLSSLGLDGK